jgi:HYDIN/CFA65/VesB family protein
MSHKVRRRMKRSWRRNESLKDKQSGLQLENLERRVLLDVAGFWDELGWRSATGGGISWDEDAGTADSDAPGEAQLVLSVDGDPIVLWIEGQFNEYADSPVPFHWEVDGSIYARQYAAEVGWWDLSPGSGDTVAIGTGSQLAATTGPDGQVVATWLSGAEIEAARWNGTIWEPLGPVSNDAVANEKPDVAVNDAGEIFVSYTAMQPRTGQREIVVKKYGYDYGDLTKVTGPPNPFTDLMWVELVNEEVDLFGVNDTSGLSNDLASSFDSSIAVDAEGRPIVVWASNNFEGNMEIYLKRWDGDSWEELGLGSASDPDTDGLSGLSNDPGISIQPDVALAANDDVVVSWINWSDWANYDNPVTGGGKAGVYVKLLSEGAGVWVEYDAGVSTTGAGIAPSLGWYYQPKIDVTSNSEPLITWQGWGALERYAVDRDSTAANADDGYHSPDLPGNRDIESPVMGVYASHYTEVTGFALLPNPDDPSAERANPTAIIDGIPRTYHCWMPTALVGPNDELIMGYTWRDTRIDDTHHDNEIFVQTWDALAGNWQSYGRGSNFSGNDVFGGPQNSAGYYSENHPDLTEAEVQLGLIDFDSDPTTEMDVMLANGEHVFLYNRQTDSWSSIDPVGGYGMVFDLRGEPEVESNVAGAPLLAYIDTDVFSPTYGLPFVLRWGGGTWNVVGGGAAFDQPGATPFDGYSTGITVQAGSNGSIYLGYMAFDGTSIDVFSRIWDGTSWANAGPETEISPGVLVSSVPEGSILQPVFYADFDGYNFDNVGITDIEIVDGERSPGFADFVDGEWYFDPLFVREAWRDWLSRGTDVTAGAFYVEIPDDDDIEDNALVMALTVPENEVTAAYDPDTELEAPFYHQFRLISESHVIIEMMYAMDAMNMDMDLYLEIDGMQIDVDPTDTNPLTPINSVLAGISEEWEPGEHTSIIEGETAPVGRIASISLDTSTLQDINGDPLDPLIMGEHFVALRAFTEVSCPDLGPDVYDSDADGPTDMRFIFPEPDPTADGYLDGWTYVDSQATPMATDGVWSATAGTTGADGGLEITIDEDASLAADYTCWFERSFTLRNGGEIGIELYFELDGTGLFGADTLDLMVTIAEGGPFGTETELNVIGDYQVSVPPPVGADTIVYGDPENPIILSSMPELGILDAGDYTVRVKGMLTNDGVDNGSQGIVHLDDITITTTDEAVTSDFDADPTMEDWGYQDISDTNDVVVGAWSLDANLGGPASGALEMVFTDGAAETDVQGAFFHDFNYGGPVTIEFDYQLIVEAAVPLDGTLVLLVAIDGEYITRNIADPPDGDPLEDLQYIVVTSDNAAQQSEADTFEVTLEGLENAIPALNALASGGHTITIEGLLSDNGGGATGTVATLTMDNFRLYGIDADDDDFVGDIPEWMVADPHRAQLRVDNFAVYQRVVPGQAIDDTEGFLGTEGPYDFTDLGNLPQSGWSYVDIMDPTVEVSGDWTDDAGAGGAGSGDDALLMTLGDNATLTEDLSGRFTYDFTLADDAFLDLSLDYYLETDANIGAHETLDVSIYIADAFAPATPVSTLLTEQVVASGGASRTPGWQTLSLTGVGDPALGFGFLFGPELNAFSSLPGNYVLVVEATLSSSGHVHTNLDQTTVDVPGQAFVKIDNVQIDSYQGTGDWEYEDGGGDTGSDDFLPWGSNNAVGPDPDLNDNVREGVYDFGACLHSTLTGTGTQRYVIEDVAQWEGGDMVVGFRYRLDSFDNLSISVKVDGVEFDELGDNAPIIADPLLLGGWWNYSYPPSTIGPEYTYVIVTAEGIAAGDHTVSIELNNTGLFPGQTELYLDNLFIFGTAVINGIQPQATLLPTGTDGQRHFALGMTSQAPNVLVYEDPGDVYPDGPVLSITSAYDVLDGYQIGSIFEYIPSINEWNTYGEILDATESVNYFRDINDATMPGGAFDMPTGELYILEDFIVGPDAMIWVALQHAETEWVDLNDPPDGINDEADIDPWDDNGTGGATVLDLDVWRWDPFNDPTNVSGQAQRWTDTGFTPFTTTGWAYTDVELVGSGGQLPSVGWTSRATEGAIMQSYVQRYEPGGVWGVLGTEDVENDQGWSANWLRDMIVRDDGLPIVSYYMGHLSTDGVREFRRAETVPAMSISEFSGIPDDGVLEFGTVLNVSVEEGFSIFNSGPGDLMVYDVEIAGIGSLASDTFSLFSAPPFPITLEPNEQEAIVVRFDPTSVPPGEYSAVLVVHTNNPTHPTHPFTHFEEILLTVEVTNGAEVSIDTNWLDFEDTVVNQTSTAQEVVITNQGTAPLTIQQWFFDDNNYDIVQAFITTTNPGGGVVHTPESTVNIADPGDDVMIPTGGTLTLQVVFNPDDVAVFNETLYIKTDDSDEPFVVVAVTGRGVSGAQIVIEEDSGLQSDDDIIDFDSVVMGQTSDPIPVVIRNDGNTPLEISDIFVDLDDIAVLSVRTDTGNPIMFPFTLSPGGGSYVFHAIYAPTSQGPTGDINPIDLESRIIIVSDDEVMPTYIVSVLGTAVPTIPILAITDEAGVEIPSTLTLNFGVLNVGQVVLQSFMVENVGGADLTLRSFIISAVNTPFTVAPVNTASVTDDIPLIMGQSEILTVTFAPTDVGIMQNTLEIRSDDRNVPNSITTVILLGAAVNPVLEVTDSYDDPNDRLIDYGVVGRNQSVTESVFLTNVGSSDITITGWSSDKPAFAIEPPFNSNITIAAGGQQELLVTFTPSVITDYTGLIAVTSDDPTNPSTFITVTGEGVAPGQVLITDSETSTPHSVINFTTALGEPLVAGFDSALESFTLANTGNSDLLIKGILLTTVYGPGAPSSWPAVELNKDTSPFVLNIPGIGNRLDPDDPADDILLNPGETLDVSTAFVPANKFNSQVWATIVTNDPAESEADSISHVILSGESIFALQVGVTAGMKQPKAILYDENGDQVQIKVTGGGFAVVVLENGAATGADIERIELYNTTKSSSLMVTSQNETRIGQIIGDTIKNVTLKNTVLDGAGVAGNSLNINTLTGTLTVDAVVNGADLYIGGVNGNGKGAKFKLGEVEDGSDLTVEAPVALLDVVSYGDGTIQAPSMNKLNAGPGDFDANVLIEEDLNNANLSSWKIDADFRIEGDLNKLSANKATFTGSLGADNATKLSFYRLQGAEIGILELLKNLTVNISVADSRILAGYDLDSQQLFNGGEIANVNVKGKFSNSNVAAGVAPYSDAQFFHPTFQNDTRSGTVGNVVLGSVEWSNNDILFGVSATSSIDKVRAGNITFTPDAENVDFRVLLL